MIASCMIDVEVSIIIIIIIIMDYHGTSIVPSHVHFRVMYPSCKGKIKIVVSDVEHEYEGTDRVTIHDRDCGTYVGNLPTIIWSKSIVRSYERMIEAVKS